MRSEQSPRRVARSQKGYFGLGQRVEEAGMPLLSVIAGAGMPLSPDAHRPQIPPYTIAATPKYVPGQT